MPITVDEESIHVRSPELLATGRECELSAYDTSYVELAERLGLPMATSDGKLKKAAGLRQIEMYLA